jgi:hypothetical protein
VGGRGIGNFAEGWTRASAAGQKIPARGSAWFAGQRPVRQRSLFDDLIFGYFVSRQSNSHPAAIERAGADSGILIIRYAETIEHIYYQS